MFIGVRFVKLAVNTHTDRSRTYECVLPDISQTYIYIIYIIYITFITDI